MLTFTLPAALNEIGRSNQNLVYNLLFRVSAAATQHLAKDLRFVGGQIALVGILHTWGRNLSYLCTLSAEEFIRRFLQHVLPKGLVKVRYYGFFAPGCRKRLTALRQQLELTYPYCANQADATQEPADSSSEPKLCCPGCGQPMLFKCEIQPTGRCPP